MTDKRKIPSRAALRTYGRLLKAAAPYRMRLVVGAVFGLMFGSSVFGLLAKGGDLLKSAFNPETETLRSTAIAASGLVFFFLLRGVGFAVSKYLVEWVGHRVVMDLRLAVFQRLQELSVSFFSHSRTGEIISRTANDTAMVERAVATVLADLVQQPFVLIAATASIFFIDARLAAFSLVLFPLCLVPIALFGRRVRRYAREGQQRLADLVSHLQENVGGARIVKAFGMEEHEREKFSEKAKSVFRFVMKVTRAKVAVEPIIVELAVIGVGLLMVYAWWYRMPFQDFFTFAGAMILMYDPVKKLGNLHIEIQRGSAAADRVFEIIDTDVSVKERPDAVELPSPIERIDFEDVCFDYGRGMVLDGIRFSVPRGHRVALVGSSGSGKTTLVNLVPRFFDATAGRVRINGRDVRDYTLTSLRSHIGIVTQDTFLFNDTVANNIRYGRWSASQADIEEAARRAHAHDFISAMPDGYRTVVGERGIRLSGGQQQRLSIARAILRNPPILILDEATSALDTESERQVQADLEALMENRTVLVIAHRLSTVVRSDRILVLDGGRICEDGTHDELLARGGAYKRLYDLQFKD